MKAKLIGQGRSSIYWVNLPSDLELNKEYDLTYDDVNRRYLILNRYNANLFDWDKNINPDYRDLLYKYMRHVLDIEGWSFLENSAQSTSDYQLTHDELEQLGLIEKEIKSKW